MLSTNKIMQQFNMPFIKTLNKFHIPTKIKKIQKKVKCINSICYQEPPNKFTISYLFYIKLNLCKIKNENLVINTLDPTFIFKIMDINHSSCLPSFKLSNDPNKIYVSYAFYNSYKNIC